VYSSIPESSEKAPFEFSKVLKTQRVGLTAQKYNKGHQRVVSIEDVDFGEKDYLESVIDKETR